VLYTASLAEKCWSLRPPEPTALADAYATIKVLAQMQNRTSILPDVQSGEERRGRAQARRPAQLVVDRSSIPSPASA